MPRWVGVDYGRRRIGLALSDYGGRIASPAEVLPGTGTAPTDARAILAWATQNEAAGIVVGLPLNMDGTDSDQTRLTRRFADALVVAMAAGGPGSGPALPIELWDERLSSFQADRLMAAVEIPRGHRKSLRDALAAQVMLQSFLDARQSPPPASETSPLPPNSL